GEGGGELEEPRRGGAPLERVELVPRPLELADLGAQVGEVVAERQLGALAPERARHAEAALVARERRAEVSRLVLRRAEVEQTEARQIIEAVALGERERGGVVLGRDPRAARAEGQDRERGTQATRIARQNRGIDLVEQRRESRLGLVRSAEIARREPEGLG